MIENLSFSLFELLALIGLFQSVSVLVYMAFRSGHIRHAIIPVLYFTVIGSAFYAEFAENFISDYADNFHLLAFFLWACVPSLSVLLIVQLVKTPNYPHIAYYGFLLLPVFLGFSFYWDKNYNSGLYSEYLPILSVVFGAVTLLGVWFKRGLLTDLYNNKENSGADRYWLSMALVFFNVLFIGGLFLESLGAFQPSIWNMLRLIISNVFVYLASTSLFRIYPQALFTVEGRPLAVDHENVLKQQLTEKEQTTLSALIGLFEVEKVYHEANLTRTELAQELKISEGLLSRLVSIHYSKSVPQLINSYRVADAITLIEQTDVAIKDISAEAGFSSIATFNRVFKDITGKSPSEYRKEAKNIIH